MQSYRIMVKGGGVFEGVYREVKGIRPGVAIKRVLDDASYPRAGSTATTGARPLTMGKGQRLEIVIERID